jgi:hypothetical protein
MKPRLIRPSYFVWLIVPIATFAFIQAWGLPHVIWNYTYRGDASRPSFRYIACSYVGPSGEFWLSANNGECSWIRFRKTVGSSGQ